MPQGFNESSYFSQILKADLADIKFSKGSTLLQYVDDLFLCPPFQTSSQEDSIPLLKVVASKGRKIAKEKNAVFPNPGSIIRISDIRTRATPKSREASWCPKFPKTQN